MIKDGRGKIITKFATARPKTYKYSVQKDHHEIKDFEFLKKKPVKTFASKELTLNDFDKRVHDVTNKPIAIEQMIFRSHIHNIYTAANNNIAMRIPNKNDKGFQDSDVIATYPHGSSFTFIKYFNNKDITNSNRKIYKIFT